MENGIECGLELIPGSKGSTRQHSNGIGFESWYNMIKVGQGKSAADTD